MSWGPREAAAFAALGRELAPHWAQANPKPTRPQPSNIWTREKIAFLQENNKRLSFSEIAQRLGVTRNAVAGKTKRLGLCNPRPFSWTKARKERLRALWPDHEVADIAATLGAKRWQVVGMAHTLKLARKSHINRSDHPPTEEA